ncbi:ABC transporter permease [Ketogulonicigenium vulgare]|uniref:Sugar ABC transporter, permease protein n=1 Tax=Ketogulonicigenium vulgare (strain WSH-001) TaxID=759362 RepID=F9Y9X4_KETVW|nr:ABC transporter permease [Ketogulonicigenium vulgare]ADO42007.1 putative sugar ABC transporter, permease protein [Ketogulonicigenium vulgare Y25]AEM40226.1 Sugar ABC transporter, permease protein [Ketogulonicigenium vulgare WSH-001]ALJ80429.1 sugar ABC transporter permease [Ketogulonicigenium vulgare]ANW33257.1 sugar ABC transporter permease [Ketogulonicigenium vulgare]AOZ53932.1 sugar ABC transporter permease [Ketogulonicigenium vulgare]
MEKMPKWADVVLIPLISLILAAIISGLVILALGSNPIAALQVMLNGALGSQYNFGNTIYYATNFIFTGLAVAVAAHAGLFNIGGEGQAMLGGLGVAIVCLMIPFPHWSLALVCSIVGAAAAGAAWAFVPAYLQAKRGSHIVITTIMFNQMAFALLNYLLVGPLKSPGGMEPASASFPATTHLPSFHDMLAPFGIAFSRGAMANFSFVIAIIAAAAVWVLIWHTRLGYEMRSLGKSEPAAKYAGINPFRIIMITMAISGGLAGMMALNNVQGEAERLILGAVEGAGFIGIAVALMGRNHPVGIVLAALLFGVLYQGGMSLSQDQTLRIPRELVVVIQALVILFTGALDTMVRTPLERLFISLRGGRSAKAAE